MCGIFGICLRQDSGIDPKKIRKIVDDLFRYSQSRGKEASGVLSRNEKDVVVHKATISGDRFIRSSEYKALFARPAAGAGLPFLMVGHARLDTNGSKWDNSNNSPLLYGDVYGIHNGIVTNVDELWASRAELQRHHVVDSEVLLALFDAGLKSGKDEQQSMADVFQQIEGSASVALYARDRATLTLATNTGSLYFSEYGDSVFVFASEGYILQQINKRHPVLRKAGPGRMQQILPGTALVLDTRAFNHASYRGRTVHEIL